MIEINTYKPCLLYLFHVALVLTSFTLLLSSFYHVGLGLFVNQVVVYPFLAKYVGLMKQFRSAAVCNKNTLCQDTL
jgi:hypothetical protein